MKSTIDLYLISGFLGAGKTTFLKNMLTNFEGKKVGVIINEFGSIGVDGTLIDKDGVQLVEINNGSIFCSCIKGGFIKTLISFSKEDIDLLIIENSGMADPSNMKSILGELGNLVGRPYEYKGAICITDSVSFLKHVQVLAPVQNQVAASNLIIINKIDKVNQFTVEEMKNKIYELNEHAFIYETMFSKVPISVLEENLYDNGYVGDTSNQPWNRPATYSLEAAGCYEQEDIIAFINKLDNKILRMKGFVKKQEGFWHIDVVGDMIEIEEAVIGKRDVIKHTKLVIIGKDEEDFKEEILDAWSQVFHTEINIYE